MQTKFDPKQTCVIIDFDKTITLGKVNGVSVPSIISILRSENHLSAEYTAAAYALEAKYRQIEMDQSLPFETRYIAMERWWSEHLDLLIKSGLDLGHIKEASESKQIVIREGFAQLVDFAFENNIPMIIFSASGIGFEPIELVLKKDNLLRENIVIISNRFVWDENGNAISRVMPTIHSLAKTGTMLKTTQAWPKIADKKFAVVVGDALHDLRMSEGINFERVISFGVLNEVTLESLELYQSKFSHVIQEGESLEKILEVFA
jgi:HAD superfamily hydrolase (TIGR01544 family)